MKLISNKNGNIANRTNFQSGAKATYNAINNGEVVGTCEFEHGYPLNKINPIFVGRGAWVLRLNNGDVIANQAIAKIRAQIA